LRQKPKCKIRVLPQKKNEKRTAIFFFARIFLLKDTREKKGFSFFFCGNQNTKTLIAKIFFCDRLLADKKKFSGLWKTFV